MTKYIVLLRGINVSGKHIIKMNEFKVHLEKLGFDNVHSYIQSGNFVFDSVINDEKQIESKIEVLIECLYDYQIPVWALKSDTFEQIKNENPFIGVNHMDESKLHISYLSIEPEKQLVEQLNGSDFGAEEFIIAGRAIYLHCPNGYGKSKLTNNFFESKLKVKATTRNLKTVNALVDTAKA